MSNRILSFLPGVRLLQSHLFLVLSCLSILLWRYPAKRLKAAVEGAGGIVPYGKSDVDYRDILFVQKLTRLFYPHGVYVIAKAYLQFF